MKYAFFAAAALLAAAPAVGSAQTPPSPDAHAGHHADADASSNTAEATGQIKSVDTKAGTITIHHGPIAALGWPAMTMTFKAAPAALQAAKAGQTVKFTLKTPDNQVVAIQPQ
jgi:Cu(I)/Ag(I) efflux system protein CusF